mmetsp:Transcript_12313/g.19540  ORF Transcript_12313/g.19540 Transcript_12313/m.19540 type:complete len:228 (-) Transcript_12313:348-1031(-)
MLPKSLSGCRSLHWSPLRHRPWTKGMQSCPSPPFPPPPFPPPRPSWLRLLERLRLLESLLPLRSRLRPPRSRERSLSRSRSSRWPSRASFFSPFFLLSLLPLRLRLLLRFLSLSLSALEESLRLRARAALWERSFFFFGSSCSGLFAVRLTLRLPDGLAFFTFFSVPSSSLRLLERLFFSSLAVLLLFFLSNFPFSSLSVSSSISSLSSLDSFFFLSSLVSKPSFSS